MKYLISLTILFIIGCQIKDFLPATMSYVDQADTTVTKKVQDFRDNVQESEGEIKQVLSDVATNVNQIDIDLYKVAKKDKNKHLEGIRQRRVMQSNQIKHEAHRISQKKLNSIEDHRPPFADILGNLLSMITDNPMISMIITAMGGGGGLAVLKNFKDNGRHKQHEQEHKRLKNIARRAARKAPDEASDILDELDS